jgi:2-oxoglutarate ferredoxin oxidoreductase subunit alpha
MEKLILIGGEAGLGTDRTSLLIAKALTRLGYYVFTYRDYPSVIKGSHNFSVIKISDQPIYSHENFYDIIIALDQKTIDWHEKNLRDGQFVLGQKNLHSKNLIPIDINAVLKKLQVTPIFGNNILIGALFKISGLPLSVLFRVFEKEFGAKADLLKKAAQEGYNAVDQKFKLGPPHKKGKYFLTGSQAVASGALAAGIDAYLAYPMTPATPVLHLLAALQEKEKIGVFQPENEISVINAALGASYAGAMSMVGTSGGGFALMGEAMSLSGISETPLVVYLAQRPAPGTGVPTYTTQGDLKFCVNVGHGEFPRVVVAPGDSNEAIQRTVEAFYLAYKYQILAILLSDKHLAESGFSFDDLEKPKVKPLRFITKNPKPDYKRYLLTNSGVSPRAVPGQGPVVKTTSYEHNEFGYTIEDPGWTVKMNDKRFKKLTSLKREISQLNPVSIYGKGKNLIIGWGSTKGAILDALRKLSSFRFMQVSYVRPFPIEAVTTEIEKANKVVLIENNVTGLLGQIIREQTGLSIEKKILKYDARPFTSQEVVTGVKRIIK